MSLTIFTSLLEIVSRTLKTATDWIEYRKTRLLTQAQPVLRQRRARDAGALPEIPAELSSTTRRGFAAIPFYWWARLVNGNAMLELWFHAVNFSDSALHLSIVAVPEFRLSDPAGIGIKSTVRFRTLTLATS